MTDLCGDPDGTTNDKGTSCFVEGHTLDVHEGSTIRTAVDDQISTVLWMSILRMCRFVVPPIQSSYACLTELRVGNADLSLEEHLTVGASMDLIEINVDTSSLTTSEPLYNYYKPNY